MSSFKNRLGQASLRMTPAVLTVFMVLLAAVPLRMPGLSQLMPSVALVSIYFWGTAAPGMLSFVFLFLLGLLEDTLTGMPLGVSSFVNILFALLLTREYRSFGKMRFGMLWFGFVLLSCVALFLQWVIMGFYLGRLLPLSGYLMQWIATCFAYPPLHLILTRIWRAMAGI